MRANVPATLENGRVKHGTWATSPEWGLNGIFHIQGPEGQLDLGGHAGHGPQAVMIHWQKKVSHIPTGWEHVTVAGIHPDRTPSWDEMGFVKELFWMPEEWVVQY